MASLLRRWSASTMYQTRTWHWFNAYTYGLWPRQGQAGSLPENRFLRNRNGIPYDIIHGTFFLAQGNGESFCSLTDKQIQTYTRLYSREKLFVMQHGKVINQPKKGKTTHER